MRISMWGMVALFISFISRASAQFEPLKTYQDSLLHQIHIDMPMESVKIALGRPKTTKGGFPEGHEWLISKLPKQYDLSNYLTWFYHYQTISLRVGLERDTAYFLNGSEVTRIKYEDYDGIDSLYFFESVLMFHGAGEGYSTRGVPGIEVVSKDRVYSYKKILTPKKETGRLQPILFVIFEKTSRRVAAKRMVFKLTYFDQFPSEADADRVSVLLNALHSGAVIEP